MRKVVFLDRDTIAPQVNVRRPAFAHEWAEYDRTTEAQAVERAKGAQIVILNKVRLPAASLAQLPELKLIAVAATGYDCIDVKAAAAQGVTISNIRGYAKATVPEHTFALILALSRSLIPYNKSLLAGRWHEAAQFCYFDYPIFDLAAKRLGLVGGGVLGGRVAEIARGFGMEVVIFDPGAPASTQGLVSFDELVETSDVISLHCPLTDQTRGLFSTPVFARMMKRPIIVDTARGGLIVEEDLEKALDAGLVSAAGLDVVLPEPPSLDSAFMRLARRQNVICTPHVAWASREGQQTLADQLIDNVENFVAGKPSNVVAGP